MRRHKTPPPAQDNNSIVVAHLNVFFCKPLNDNCVGNKHDDNLHLPKLIKYIVQILLLFEFSMKLIFLVTKLAQRFPFKQRLIFKDMKINSCVTMPIVFNFLYIFLKLSLIHI